MRVGGKDHAVNRSRQSGARRRRLAVGEGKDLQSLLKILKMLGVGDKAGDACGHAAGVGQNDDALREVGGIPRQIDLHRAILDLAALKAPLVDHRIAAVDLLNEGIIRDAERGIERNERRVLAKVCRIKACRHVIGNARLGRINGIARDRGRIELREGCDHHAGRRVTEGRVLLGDVKKHAVGILVRKELHAGRRLAARRVAGGERKRQKNEREKK